MDRVQAFWHHTAKVTNESPLPQRLSEGLWCLALARVNRLPIAFLSPHNPASSSLHPTKRTPLGLAQTSTSCAHAGIGTHEHKRLGADAARTSCYCTLPPSPVVIQRPKKKQNLTPNGAPVEGAPGRSSHCVVIVSRRRRRPRLPARNQTQRALQRPKLSCICAWWSISV